MLLGFGSREVYESANGVEAFELARNVMPNIIITDLVMPIFNGLRFIKMAKEPQSPCPQDSDHRLVRISDQSRGADDKKLGRGRITGQAGLAEVAL